MQKFGYLAFVAAALLGLLFSVPRTHAASAPYLSALYGNIANGYNHGWTAGSTIMIYVDFTENVTFNTANLVLTIGGQQVTVPCSSGKGTNHLTFQYDVRSDSPNGKIIVSRWGNQDIKSAGMGVPYVPLDGGDLSSYYINDKNNYVDTVAPRLVSVSSPDPDYSYKAGETLTLQVKFSEAVQNSYSASPELILNNGGWGSYESGEGSDTFSFSYYVTSGDDTNNLDITRIDGQVYDLAGNAASLDLSAVPHLSDVKHLRIDTTGPGIQIGQNPAQTVCTRDHAQVTASDAGSGLGLIYYKWVKAGESPDWSTVTDTVPSGGILCTPVDPTVNGSYHLYVRAVDKIGNVSLAQSRAYLIDNEKPVVQLSSESGPARHMHTVHIQANDEGSGLASLVYTWTNRDNNRIYGPFPVGVSGMDASADVTTPTEEGDYVLSVTVMDVQGNGETRVSQGQYIVDRTPPAVTFQFSGNDTAAQSHTVTVHAADAKGETGPLYYAWADRVDYEPANGWTPPDGWALLQNNTATTPPGVSGTMYLYVKATDNPRFPDESNVGYTVETSGFLLDNTPPASHFTVDGTDTYARQITTEIVVPDDVASIRYTVSEQPDTDGDDSGWQTSSGTVTLMDMTGQYYIHAHIYDLAGNMYTLHSRRFLLDNEGPVGEITAVAPYTNRMRLPLHLSADDPGGVAEMSVYSETTGWSAWIPFASTYETELSPVEGSHTLKVKFRDSTGNESGVITGTAFYDVTPPTVAQVVYSSREWTNQPVTVTLNLADNLTAPGQIRVTNHSGPAYTFQKNGTFEFEFADLAGNVNRQTVAVSNIDTTLPEIRFMPDGQPGKRQQAASAVTAADNAVEPSRLVLYAAWSSDADHAPSDWRSVDPGEALRLKDTDGTWYLWAKAVDPAGNVRISRSAPFFLDNTAPVGTISYSTTGRTASEVTASLTVNETVTVTAPADGSRTHTFSENGSFTFEFVDEAGNRGTATAVVGNIDKNAPSAHVTRTPDSWTNQPVSVSVDVYGQPPRALSDFSWTGEAKLLSLYTAGGQTVTGSVYGYTDGGTVAGSVYGTIVSAVFEFNGNGQLNYTIRDLDTGLESAGNAVVDRIDRTAPAARIVYSRTGWTNQDVTATLLAEDDRSSVTILNNGGGNTYTFRENGSFTFRYRDEAGNEGELTAVVDTIDKDPPHPVLAYSETGWTNRDVTVDLSFDNEFRPVTILNNNGSSRYIFTENGSFTFDYRDAAGNAGQVTAEVHGIDKEAPAGSLTYSTLQWTNRDVTADLTATDNSGEPVRILNNGGSPRYVFTDNGEFTFQLEDAAGNRNEVKAVVNRIDKDPPAVQVQYSTTDPTNSHVRAAVLANEPIIVENNGGSRVYDFGDNGEFTFIVRDYAGNTLPVKAVVGNIDRTPPVPAVTYSTTAPTKDPVVATVTADEPIQVLNNARKSQYVSDSNGEFTFLIRDLAGNQTEVRATVGNMDKSLPVISLDYSETAPTRNNVTVTVHSDRPLTILNNNGSSRIVFTTNGVQWIEARDSLGNQLEIPVRVDNIDREMPTFRFAKGDVLLVPLGRTVDPLADVQAEDAADGDLTRQVKVEGAINPEAAGDYNLRYTVTDRAGNTAEVTRKARVLGADHLEVYVNGTIPVNDEAIVNDHTIRLDLFGARGDVKAIWVYGKKSRGDLKNAGQEMANGTLEVTRSGYYTILVQDQERNTRLLYVYVFIR